MTRHRQHITHLDDGLGRDRPLLECQTPDQRVIGNDIDSARVPARTLVDHLDGVARENLR